jgi:hypothetical protein
MESVGQTNLGPLASIRCKESGRLAPLAIICSVRFSAASRDSACDVLASFNLSFDSNSGASPCSWPSWRCAGGKAGCDTGAFSSFDADRTLWSHCSWRIACSILRPFGLSELPRDWIRSRLVSVRPTKIEIPKCVDEVNSRAVLDARHRHDVPPLITPRKAQALQVMRLKRPIFGKHLRGFLLITK